MSIKDSLLAKTLQIFVSRRIERYGTIEDLSIDTSARKIEATLKLAGEKESTVVTITDYSIADGILTIGGISSSKQWLTHLAEDYILKRRFTIVNNDLLKKIVELLA